jgi:hypothetical protein
LGFIKRADTIATGTTSIAIAGTVANETNSRIESNHDYIISNMMMIMIIIIIIIIIMMMVMITTMMIMMMMII